MRLYLLSLTLLSVGFGLCQTNITDVELQCFRLFQVLVRISCAPTTGEVDVANCSIDGTPFSPCDLNSIKTDVLTFTPDVHTLTITFNLTTGEEGIHHFNFTGRVRERLLIGLSLEAVINATEAGVVDFGFRVTGDSYGVVMVKVYFLSYSEYAERGFNLEDDFEPSVIPASPADKYDYGASSLNFYVAGFSPLFLVAIPIYDDGVSEDVEGFVIFLEIIESELDPRDVGQVNLTRSSHLVIINPSGTSTFQVLTGEVELETRPELISVAATPSSSYFTPPARAFVTDYVQTVILTESSAVALDWLKWVTDHPVVGVLLENTTFIVRRTQLDEYRNPIGPPLEVMPLGRIRVLLNAETREFLVQISRALVRAEDDEEPDRAFFEMEACVPMPFNVTECFRSGITVYAIPDPIGLICAVTGSRWLAIECDVLNAVIHELYCIYDTTAGEVNELCYLPVVIDIALYDSNPGEHGLALLATSTLFGESANFSLSFTLPEIECVQLTEPGRTTLICFSRVTLVDRPLCLFYDLIQVPCDSLHNIVVSASVYPFHVGVRNLSIIATDDTMQRITKIVSISLSEEQLVECSTTLSCDNSSSDSVNSRQLISARECCVNSEDGLSYSIPGQPQCHICIAFGWLQETFIGMEQESAHMIHAGYLKGWEEAGMEIALGVVSTLENASAADFVLETDIVYYSPMAPNTSVLVTFNVDGLAREGKEMLTLELVPPAPSALLTFPYGEGVFFKNFITLTIIDSNGPEGEVSSVALPVGSAVGGLAVLLVIVGIVVAVSIHFHRRRSFHVKKDRMDPLTDEDSRHIHFLFVDDHPQPESSHAIRVQSSFKLDIPLHLIIPSSRIKLTETIGHGEFGIVYKGHMVKKRRNGQYLNDYLAIKTLKGFYDHATVKDMLKECSEMHKFDHPNVLTLKGVCLDGGPAPYIIMPFMANGSLLAYLKNNRKNLVVSHSNQGSDVEIVHKQLMDVCHQIAKGMEYLTRMNVVHRDLAARNCMIDSSFVIKVADFGLAEKVGSKEYFRLDKATSETVKLPLKWLALESISDYIFSEKSDVWAYGVTCWEVFTGGKVPYFNLAPADIPKQLANGYRLEKPHNEACNQQMYEIMLRCWALESDERPSFSHLVKLLSQMLEGVAGYMDVRPLGVTTLSTCSTSIVTESEVNLIQEAKYYEPSLEKS